MLVTWMTARSAAKIAAYYSAALPALHRLRHRESLTVLMFHRVLPRAEMERQQADPIYTVTPDYFADVLTFASHHYRLVGIDQVLAAHERAASLPSHSLLITFDDGWHDNLEYALPLLRCHDAPAVLFVASDPVESATRSWWQEVVLWANRARPDDITALWHCVGAADRVPAPGQPDRELRLLVQLGEMDPERRDAALAPLTRRFEERNPARLMLNGRELRELTPSKIAIGGHGASHLPLTRVADARGDVDRAQRAIAAALDTTEVSSMSFPHGQYDARVAAASRAAGYRLLFTSDAIINACPGGRVVSDLIGRIPVTMTASTDARGRFSPAEFATWLFLRPLGTLRGEPSAEVEQ
jgi:peptidoglycan/xylan/chitin deacetylase (PgdA/CDA1 family)